MAGCDVSLAHRHLAIPTYPMHCRRESLILFLIVLFAALLRAVNLDRGLWIDELTTWAMTTFPVWEMMRLRFEAGHVPLYFLFMRLYAGLTPDLQWVLRLPSFFFSVAAVALLPWMTAGRVSRSTALFATFFLAIHPGDIWAAQTARMYAPLSFFTLLATGFALRLMESSSVRLLAAWGFSTLAGVLLHPLFSVFAAIQIGILVWVRRADRTDLARLALTVGGIVVCALPFWLGVVFFKGAAHGAREATGLNWKPGVDMLASLAAGDYLRAGWGNHLRLPGLAVVGVVGVLYLLHWRRSGFARFETFLLLLVAGYFIVTFAGVQLFKHHGGGVRYYVALAPAWCLMTAIAAGSLASATGRAVVFALVAATMGLGSAVWLNFRGDGLDRAIEMVRLNRLPGEAVIGCDGGSLDFALQFYGVGSVAEFLPVDRNQLDVQALRDAVQAHLDLHAGGAWVLFFHENQSPLASIIGGLESHVVVDELIVGRARVLRLWPTGVPHP